MKLLKSENRDELKIERVQYVKRYSLVLDKNLCKGCGICELVCPREAIVTLKRSKSSEQEKAEQPSIDISEEECDYCGICDAICPFGAIKTKVDGTHVVPVYVTESFPQIIHDIQIDTTKCEVGCSDCEKACPLNIIKTRRVSPLERAREKLRARKDPNANLRPLVEVQLDSCPGCGLCAIKCPQEAINTRKIFAGTISVNRNKCPQGCRDCLDVCPFPGALYLGEDGKIYTNESVCTYCGVCKVVCPVEDALDLKRTHIRHTPVRSGAWNKALEKLTSTKDLAKELQTKSLAKTRESVQRRFSSLKPQKDV